MHQPPAKKGPRAASSYRGARRNAAKALRRLPEWRDQAANVANQKANLYGRSLQANMAREVAAKAVASGQFGLPHVLAAAAMLNFYCGEKQTRSISRIVRDLQKQVRSARA